jgi:hypothetical protein
MADNWSNTHQLFNETCACFSIRSSVFRDKIRPAGKQGTEHEISHEICYFSKWNQELKLRWRQTLVNTPQDRIDVWGKT